MIQKQTFVMTLMNMFTHIHKSTHLYATPEAEPRGILLIKEKKILFRYVGLDPATVELVEKCNRIEVVMMLSGARESITLRRAERNRKKRYEKLPEIHKRAFEKGLFETEHACYNREFEPYYLNKN